MFKQDPSNTVIINATNIGYKFHGIGVYSLNILKEISKLKTDLNFIVYLNKSSKSYIDEINYPENFRLKWVSSIISPDKKFKGHLLRLIYSNLISFKYRNYLQFNTSQLEINFFRSNQIVTVHDVIPLLFRKYHKKQYFYFKLILKYGLINARYILTPSYHSKDMLMKIFNLQEERVKAIHNGANTLHLNSVHLTVREKDNYILYVGRINQMKNIGALLTAYSMIYKKINHDLVVISDDKNSLEREINKANLNDEVVQRIIFKENVNEEEKIKIMSRASMLVSPTLYEGFGLPPIEAMACGCPVIVSNTSCIPEVCGGAALYIDPYNTNSIATAIVELIENENLRAKLIERGLTRVRGFRWEFSAMEHLRVFENVLAYKAFPVEKRELVFRGLPGSVEPAGFGN
ncbi:MAG TPA: glycosyltransferase family 1 protein [Ignavibacteriaceae bacterium]|nr:glycosyltransferase family 1 protein [Ignavibacteriaceae bacterium]